MSDDGETRAPKRYAARGRETIDTIRDALGDKGFAAFCRGNAIKYRERLGLKEGVDADRDLQAALWYEAMAKHARGLGPDPRESRGEAFRPYVPRGRRHPGTGYRTDQVVALLRNAGEGGLTVADVMLLTGVKRSSVSESLRLAVKAGLVKRDGAVRCGNRPPGPGQGRAAVVYVAITEPLTGKGRPG